MNVETLKMEKVTVRQMHVLEGTALLVSADDCPLDVLLMEQELEASA